MGSILKKVNNPADLRSLSKKELLTLASEIREKIINTVSKRGGHLASNLGTVELTLAIHYVFDTPRDKVLWDVGHQCYTHKIITGRKDRFHTIRQYGGLSGFPRRDESPYDTYDTGHSSTTISAGIGMVEAREIEGEDYKVIVVIGDGSMTAGIAFEGLNYAGQLNKDFIVILNDNEMSISPNVGALANYLARIMTGQWINRFRNDIKSILKTMPGIGESVVKIVKQVEESLKGFISPGILFEELGFTYVGPIDGHRIDVLINTFSNVKKMKGPILVHTITKKGHGYLPAEKDPSFFHGLGPFKPKTGKLITDQNSPPTYTHVFGDTIVEIAKKDSKIVAITAAMPEGTGLSRFAKEIPDRFYDIGIAEQHGVSFAAGLALNGAKPVVAIYSTFLQRAYDQIIQDVCLQNLPVVFAIDRAGIVGEDGPTHHGVFDLSYLRAIPNMIVMAPKDENELRHMINTAFTLSSPVAVRYPRGKGIGVPLDPFLSLVDVGKGEILKEGGDLVIFAIGSMVYPSLKAASLLINKGIYATVVNCRFVKPMDEELISELASEIPFVLTVEENVLDGGFGSGVIETLVNNEVSNVKIKRVGLPSVFVEHGHQDLLRNKYKLNAEGIANEAITLIEQQPHHAEPVHHIKSLKKGLFIGKNIKH